MPMELLEFLSIHFDTFAAYTESRCPPELKGVFKLGEVVYSIYPCDCSRTPAVINKVYKLGIVYSTIL